MKNIQCIILAVVCILPLPMLGAEEAYVVEPDDPLILIGSDRLEPIIRALRTKDKVELLLGKGVAANEEGSVVRYVVVESYPRETRFVRSVQVKYEANGTVQDVKIPYPTKKSMVSPKVCAGHLASQVPASIEGMNQLIERTFNREQEVKPEASPGKLNVDETKTVPDK